MFSSSDISVFNWTATYRRDSTIVTPYERWVYYNQAIKTQHQSRNYAANKTGQVAWFVSNCGARWGLLLLTTDYPAIVMEGCSMHRS